MDILKCCKCCKPAKYINSFHPYHSEQTLCETHYEEMINKIYERIVEED